MVRAVQSLRKTQTRRPMYPQPARTTDGRFFRADGREIVCPFGIPGDQLWVRERFAYAESGEILYAADPVKGRSRLDWQQSRYLPRDASRLTLKILSTRAQRLQEIDEADARAEGYDASQSLSPIDWFARLWDRLAVVESLRWAANPWLWVVHFQLIASPSASPTPLPTHVIADSLFDSPGQAASPPAKARGQIRRTATIEEKRLLAERLRSGGPLR